MLLEELSNIADNLAAMPDVALPRFAQMHKSDPYIMALVVSESNRRKAARVAKAPQVQPELTIADEEIAEMSGIAALPAENMEMMSAAAGGIIGDMNDGYDMAVGYADGGVVERYNGRTGSYTGKYEDLPLYQMPTYGTVDKLLLSPFNASEKRRVDPVTGEPISFGEFMRRQEAERARQATAVAQRGKQEKGSVPPIEGMLDAQGKALPAPATTPTARPPAATTRPPADTTPRPSEVPTPTVADAKRLAGEFSASDAVSMATQSMEDLANAQNAAARARMQQGKPEGKAYEGLEALLKKEGEGAASEKEEAKGMAIVRAGLAILGGESQSALTNIGKGLTTGLDDYKSFVKEFKKSERERNKAMADIEQARRAEAREDWKAAQQFEEKAADRLFNAKKFGVDALVQSRVADARTAGSIYERLLSEAGQTNRARAQDEAAMARTRMQLGQEPAELRTLRAVMADPKLLSAYQQMQSVRGSGLNALLGKYADPAELALLKATQPELYAQVMAAMQRAMMPAPVSNPGGPVRP